MQHKYHLRGEINILHREVITSKNYFPCLLLARGTRPVQVRQNSLEKLRLTAEKSLEKLRWVFEKSLKKVYFCFQIKCHTMLKRKIEDDLIAWKNKPGHKPLVT